MSESHDKNLFDTDELKKEVREIVIERIIPAVDKHLRQAQDVAHKGKEDVEEKVEDVKEEKHPRRKRSWFSLFVFAIIGFLVGRVSHK